MTTVVTTSSSERPSRPGSDVRLGRSDDQILRANGVGLCAQTFGDPADPALLLIHGVATSMLGWEDAFCGRLAAGSRFVVRYDHRDTGRSVSYPPGAPAYTFRDLVADALGVVDALGLGTAHLVGMSMGGGIAQTLALAHPDRVASLTLISTSPTSTRPDTLDLPPPSADYVAFAARATAPDWSDPEAVIEHMVRFERICAARSRPFDDLARREVAARVVARTANVASSQLNHFAMTGGEPTTNRLAEVIAPTLVIHGAEDPMFPLGHALALKNEIPGARLLTLERTGHELPRAVWDIVVPAILRHTSV